MEHIPNILENIIGFTVFGIMPLSIPIGLLFMD